MRVIVQRGEYGKCTVDGNITGEINDGLLLLVGFTEGDDSSKIVEMAKKIVNLRIMDDDDGVMNKSILDTNGSILSISQFTLYADTKKGNRPSYINAMKGDKAILLYDEFNNELRKYVNVEIGKFGADMHIEAHLSGPVTITLER